jgi:hypothetical protein
MILPPAGKTLITSSALSTAEAGAIEYDGTAFYATAQGTQRGVIPGAQYYRLNSTLAGANATGAQNILGVGCTLSSSTVYAFEGQFAISKTAGITNHTVALGFGGTATINNIGYQSINQGDSTAFTTVPYAGTFFWTWIQTASSTVVTGINSTAGSYRSIWIKGTVSVNSGGTFIPQYTLSAAPGGAYTAQIGSYFLIYPVSASGAASNVGTWA